LAVPLSAALFRGSVRGASQTWNLPLRRSCCPARACEPVRGGQNLPPRWQQKPKKVLASRRVFVRFCQLLQWPGRHGPSGNGCHRPLVAQTVRSRTIPLFPFCPLCAADTMLSGYPSFIAVFAGGSRVGLAFPQAPAAIARKAPAGTAACVSCCLLARPWIQNMLRRYRNVLGAALN
jgi:hypothetical protein